MRGPSWCRTIRAAALPLTLLLATTGCGASVDREGDAGPPGADALAGAEGGPCASCVSADCDGDGL